MKTLLILHGWGSCAKNWSQVKELLEKQGCKVLVPDLPGFGENPSPPKPWAVDDYVKWVKEYSEKQNLSQFFLLGHSFGGRIAIKFSKKYPEKISSLILCSSAGIKPKADFKTKIISLLAKIGKFVFSFKFFKKFEDKITALFQLLFGSRDYLQARKKGEIMKETIKKVLGEDLLLDLAEIKTKTLIIWGENDKMVPIKYARIFKEKIENSELEIIPKIGHSPHLEVSKKLSKIIINFLE